MPNKQSERYPLERSPFWRMRKIEDLAKIIGLQSKSDLKKLISKREYFYFTDVKILGEKKRFIAKPIGEIGKIHERIKELLDRIQQPSHIYSPRKGKTPKGNAEAHENSKMFFKIDIRQFYPSTTREHVFRFCLYGLQMSNHVAGAFAKIVTFEGKLPFGSPLSPVLCTFVHKDVFDRIAEISSVKGHTLTVWVDDIVVSGDNIDEKLIRGINNAIRRKGLIPHKARTASCKNGVEITGHFVSVSAFAPAQRTHHKIKKNLQKLDEATSPEERIGIIRSLIGQMNYVRTIYPPDSEEFTRVQSRIQWLHQERREAEKLLLQQSSPIGNFSDSDTVPWDH